MHNIDVHCTIITSKEHYPMTKIGEGAGKFGDEAVDTGLKSLAALSKSAQAIAAESTEFSKRSFQELVSTWKGVMAAGSVEKAIQIQTGYAKSAYEDMVAEVTKLTGLYADMSKEIYKPFEAAMAKAK